MTPFRTRSTKQRLADTRLAVRRGPSVGQDTESRDPFAVGGPPKRKSMGAAPRFRMKSPSFGSRRQGRY